MQKDGGVKRSAEGTGNTNDTGQLIKKPRIEGNELITSTRAQPGQLILMGPKRTSSLLAPTLLLSGHKGEVFSMKFNTEGTAFASASFDKTIFLWGLHQGECTNYAVLRGHSGPVLEVHWSTDSNFLYSASVDKSVAVWDSDTGVRIKKLRGHSSYVNSCCVARKQPQLITSGSDDSTVKLWDTRVKGAIHSFANKYPVTTVCFSDNADQIISGSIDNNIKIWDLRKNATILTLTGHTESITSVCLSPDGNFILSNSMDNLLKIWDIRPFVVGDQRCAKTFPEGTVHTFEKNLLKCAWSPDGSKISAGSGDRFVYIIDVATRKILYKLPGHAGSVNEVAFHPKEPIIGSCSSDKNIFLGELLQPEL